MDDDEVMDMVNDEIQAYRKEKNEREQEWKYRIEYYKESKKKISKQLEGKKGRDKEYVENRMKSCDRLIKGYRTKLNPTGKKEMYK